MIASIVLLSLGLVCAGAFIWSKAIRYSMLTVILKTLASSLFVALAIYLFFYKEFPNVGIFIIAGAVLGLLGDVSLGLKRIFKKQEKLFILLGLLFFTAGHLVYVVGLFNNFYIPGNVLVIILPIVCSLLCGSIVVPFEKVLKLHLSSLRYGVMVYFICLSSLSISSFALLAEHSFNSTFLIMMTIGGGFFFISDVILSKTYFGENVRKIDLISTSIAYFLAQFIIAFALFFL